MAILLTGEHEPAIDEAMTDFSRQPRQRRTSDEVTARREALHLVRPFMARFDDWNHRAARATATILSHLTTESEKLVQRQALGQLRAEVKKAHDEFRAVASKSPRHSRIDDVDAAFSRLLSTLQSRH